MSKIEQLSLWGLVVWNGLVFLLFGLDKGLSKTEARRVPEKTLLGAAFLFGGVGAAAGMQIFRHKTKHENFKVLVPIAAALTLFAGYKIAG